MKTNNKLDPRRIPRLPGLKGKRIVSIEVPSIEDIDTDTLKVEKIELSDEYTRIDFIHYADKIYDNGGWVQMYPETYIQPNGTDIKLKLLNVINIPIAPTKHHYKHRNDRLAFSLFFPAVPKEVEYLDLIEKLHGGSNYFNVYGIMIQEIESGPINLNNLSLN